jgi:hypothetical protein
MPFIPKYTIIPRINKALVEIERVRGFLDAVKLKDDWLVDLQKKGLLLRKGVLKGAYYVLSSTVSRI